MRAFSTTERRGSGNARRGSGMTAVLALTILLGALSATLVTLSVEKYLQGGRLRRTIALHHLVEGGLERARAELARNPAYQGAERVRLGRGEVTIQVSAAADGRRIRVTAGVPDLESPDQTDRREVVWNGER